MNPIKTKKKDTCTCCLKDKTITEFKWVLFKQKVEPHNNPYYFCDDDCLTKWAKRKQW